MRKLLEEWTLKKIKKRPKLFGGDNGNPAIILEYLNEISENDKISSLSYGTVSNSVTVSRLKNELLLEYPEYDNRVDNKPKDIVGK